MANEYLKRTPTSTGNQKVWTVSTWIKQIDITGAGGNGSFLFGYYDEGASPTPRGSIQINESAVDGKHSIGWNPTGSSWYQTTPEGRYRDNQNWYHLLVAIDTTKSAESDGVQMYFNGVKRESESYLGTWDSGAAALNIDTGFNSLVEHYIGAFSESVPQSQLQYSDFFYIDGQQLGPEVFGYYKKGDGYISVGTTQATDFKKGQWVPKAPKVIKSVINARGGFGVNGFYLPMNDDSNFGADFHCEPNSIIKLKGEDFNEYPQPRNGAPTTTDAYVSQLRTDPYAANLVLAVPGISGGQGSGYGDYSADIKGSGTNKTLTANGNAGIAVTASYYGSAMQFDGTSDYFSIPNNSDFYFNSDFTVEMWVYRNKNNTSETLVSFFENSSARRSWQIENRTNSAMRFEWWSDGSSASDITTASNTAPSGQWNHVVMEKHNDTMRGYVNGVVVGVDITAGSLYENTQDPLRIGVLNAAEDGDFSGYIQDLRIYKGVAKYKGGFDVPKPYTPVGIGTWRAVSDTTANNFATLNPLHHGTSITESDGNLSATWSGSGWQQVTGTVGVSTGKWYWESVQTSAGNQMSGIILTGIGTVTVHLGQTTDESLGYYGTNGNIYYNSTDVAYGDTWTQNDIIGIAFNATDREIEFYKNGASQGIQTGYTIGIRTEGTYAPAYATNNSGNTSFNFGQNPTFSGNITAGSYTDSNGKGLFKYEPPSGFLALCEDNLPTPAIKNPGEYFKTVLYTGDSNSGRSITGVGFQPDLVWIKERTSTSSNTLSDSVRGSGNILLSDTTDGELTGQVALTSFDSDGFSVGNDGKTNQSGQNYVAWCWKAGGGSNTFNVDGTGYATASAAGITDGSIALTGASVNTAAGFSIVSYTGTGSAGTVGHGIDGKTPSMIIVKGRTNVDHWFVYNSNLTSPTTQYLYLNLTNGETSGANPWNSTNPTSSVFSLGTDGGVNGDGNTYIAYCWAEIEGFSKFGSYVGNGDADGPFVYCGFKPAWVMVKPSSYTSNWIIMDSSRSSTNGNTKWLYPDGNFVEEDGAGRYVDLLSNGFKIRNGSSGTNTDGGTIIFAAFAESPFTTANAK